MADVEDDNGGGRVEDGVGVDVVGGLEDAGEGPEITDTKLIGTRVPLCEVYAARVNNNAREQGEGG